MRSKPNGNLTRRALCAASLAGLLTCGGMATASQAQELPTVKIGVAGRNFVPYMPIVLAKQLGQFKKAGLDAQIVSINGGSLVATALISGSVDVASGYYEHTISFAAKGKDVRSIVLGTKLPGMALYVAPPSTDEVKTVEDLKGKSIGVTSPGSATDFLLKYILEKNGVDPSSVSVVTVGGPASTIAAAEHGQVAAVVNGEPSITPLQVKHPDLRILADTRTEKGTRELFGGEYPAASLYAKQSWIESHPEESAKLAEAMVATLHWMRDNPPKVWVEHMPQDIIGDDPDLYLTIVQNMSQIFSKDGIISEEDAKNPLKLLEKSVPDIKSANVDITKTYTNKFAKMANEKLGK